MSYSINVALNGRHYFATTERSLSTSEQTANMVADFVKRFPASEGFSISLSYNPGISYGFNDIKPSDIANIADLQRDIASLGNKDSY